MWGRKGKSSSQAIGGHRSDVRREDAARGDHHKPLGSQEWSEAGKYCKERPSQVIRGIWSGANSFVLQVFIDIFLVQLIEVWSEQWPPHVIVWWLIEVWSEQWTMSVCDDWFKFGQSSDPPCLRVMSDSSQSSDPCQCVIAIWNGQWHYTSDVGGGGGVELSPSWAVIWQVLHWMVWAAIAIGECGGILEWAVIWQVLHWMVWAAIAIVVCGGILKQAVTIDAGERSE